MISISVISHGQGDLVGQVLGDLGHLPESKHFEVILTKNIPEQLAFSVEEFPYPVKLIENATPKGFGANHNAAFKLAEGKWFCVLNPDIRIVADPFPRLLSCLQEADASVAGPLVLAPDGGVEDSARRFPTPLTLAAKLFGLSDGRYSLLDTDAGFPVDWVAGMFMLFRAEDFQRVGGFDEGFFLYYEDVDICARLWNAGLRVLACPKAQVIHDARRASRHDLKYLRWHIASLARYLGKHWLRLPNTQGR
jgi:N-acetylglucosaminyl-diphospho-decaprenol L-rhamnosyltransferase